MRLYFKPRSVLESVKMKHEMYLEKVSPAVWFVEEGGIHILRQSWEFINDLPWVICLDIVVYQTENVGICKTNDKVYQNLIEFHSLPSSQENDEKLYQKVNFVVGWNSGFLVHFCLVAERFIKGIKSGSL